LYLCHANVREFRGQAIYPIASCFLGELPSEEIEHIDLTAGRTTEHEWHRLLRTSDLTAAVTTSIKDDRTGYVIGMMVRHENYGGGRVTDISGYGALRKVKVRFAAHGERTFIADKARLTIVPSK
jgi:DNA helicase-2/ATP-dependent DNA helicase PcrA